jgi:hypothetical protein
VEKKKESVFGWLGRQIGYVKGGVKAQVPAVVYRKETVQEAKVEGKPEQTLRRTTVDEVIVEPEKLDQKNMGETPMPRKD